MDNYITTTNNSGTMTAADGIKSLWKRPGGTFARITAWIAMGGIAVVFCKYILPLMIAATQNLIIFVVELCVLAAILFIVTSKEFQRALSLTWLQVMRKLYGLIVNIDPINILQNGINEMKKKLQVVDENVTKLESVLVSMKKKLAEYKSNFDNNIRRYDALKRKIQSMDDDTDALHYKAQLQLINNEITRGSEQIRSQSERIVTSEKYLDIMKKLQVAADFKVRDAENDLSYRKDEYEQAKAQQKAVGSITSILKGGLTRSMEEELAMDQVSDTINTSIAEINRLLDGSNDILVNFELNQDVNSEKADEIVKMFNKNGFSIFDTNDEPQMSFSGSNQKLIPDAQVEYIDTTPQKEKATEDRYF